MNGNLIIIQVHNQNNLLPALSFNIQYSKKVNGAKKDELLSVYVKNFYYKNWKLISQHIKGRTAVQCLHRWTNILKPRISQRFIEDDKLLEFVKTQGATKWTLCSEPM